MRCVSVNTDHVDVVADAGTGADVGVVADDVAMGLLRSLCAAIVA